MSTHERQLELLWFGLWAIRTAASMDADSARAGRIADALTGMADIPEGNEDEVWAYWDDHVLPRLIEDLPHDLDLRIADLTRWSSP